jgi:molybdopterin-guanine dinucleotide biosynthesis protein A
MNSVPIAGLVLSGGRSTRMGVDKSTLEYHGLPQLRYMVDLLAEVCNEAFISTRIDQPVAEGLRVLPDAFDIPGPLNGILTAMQRKPDLAWLVVAVDMPKVDKNVLDNLINGRDGSKLATCFFNVHENFPEPLLTLWEPSALPRLLQFIATGKISPREFLQNHDVKLIRPEDPAILLNINSPDEYEKFKKRLSKD